MMKHVRLDKSCKWNGQGKYLDVSWTYAWLNNVSAHKMTLVLAANAKGLDRNRGHVRSCTWQNDCTVVEWQKSGKLHLMKSYGELVDYQKKHVD